MRFTQISEKPVRRCIPWSTRHTALGILYCTQSGYMWCQTCFGKFAQDQSFLSDLVKIYNFFPFTDIMIESTDSKLQYLQTVRPWTKR